MPEFCGDVQVESVAEYISTYLEWAGIEIPEFEIQRNPGVGTKKVITTERVDPMEMSKHLSLEKATDLFKKIKGQYDRINIFDNKTFTNIDVMKCHFAPDTMRCRRYIVEYAYDLANSFLAYSGVAFPKRTHALVPIRWDPPGDGRPYKGTPFETRPTEEDIKSCHFWIIGGQHTIMAYRKLVYEYKEEDVPSRLREELRTTQAIIFWDKPHPDRNHLMMSLSLTLNDPNNTQLVEPEFFMVATQVRNLWRSFGRPPKRTTSPQEKLNWKVSHPSCLCFFMIQVQFLSMVMNLF